MRFIFIVFFLNTLITFGQNSNAKMCETQLDTLTKQSVYRDVDKKASFPGGAAALSKEISKRMRLPSGDKLQGGIKVLVAFIVQPDGKITGKRVIRNVKGTDLAEQFLDIIDDFQWEPGICNGKVVSTIQIFPMILCLD